MRDLTPYIVFVPFNNLSVSIYKNEIFCEYKSASLFLVHSVEETEILSYLDVEPN